MVLGNFKLIQLYGASTAAQVRLSIALAGRKVRPGAMIKFNCCCLILAMQLNAMTTWAATGRWYWEKELLAEANQLNLGNESNLGPNCALLG